MTKQLAEHIVVDGIECLLLSTPLDSVLGAVPLVPPHTALWRGYIGEWRIEGDYLLLMGLRAWVPGSDGTPVEVSADVVLPGCTLPVAASWVTSTLRVAAGAELRYVHAGFESTYEHEWLLEVRNGIVVSREKLATSSVGQAGPFLVDDSDFWSGAFGSLLTARGPDARPLVAKVPRPCGGQGNTEVWSSGETPRLPVHTPASTYRRTSAGWERWRLSDADVAAVLERENEILIRDGGQLLPFSHGIWTLEPLGLPALIMERLEGSHPAGPTDVRATLAAVARAVERGTLRAHGDLKFEHVFASRPGGYGCAIRRRFSPTRSCARSPSTTTRTDGTAPLRTSPPAPRCCAFCGARKVRAALSRPPSSLTRNRRGGRVTTTRRCADLTWSWERRGGDRTLPWAATLGGFRSMRVRHIVTIGGP